MRKMNKIEDFINRRFKQDCNWLNGNCYYFTLILKDRFPEGEIFYDVIKGHFVFKYDNSYYDWLGRINCKKEHLVLWENFSEYDNIQRKRIIRDCIQ